MLKNQIFVFSADRTCIENDRIFDLRPAIYAQIITLSISSKDGGALRVFVAVYALYVRALLAAGYCATLTYISHILCVRFYCDPVYVNRQCSSMLAGIALHHAQSRLSMHPDGLATST